MLAPAEPGQGTGSVSQPRDAPSSQASTSTRTTYIGFDLARAEIASAASDDDIEVGGFADNLSVLRVAAAAATDGRGGLARRLLNRLHVHIWTSSDAKSRHLLLAHVEELLRNVNEGGRAF